MSAITSCSLICSKGKLLLLSVQDSTLEEPARGPSCGFAPAASTLSMTSMTRDDYVQCCCPQTLELVQAMQQLGQGLPQLAALHLARTEAREQVAAYARADT